MPVELERFVKVEGRVKAIETDLGKLCLQVTEHTKKIDTLNEANQSMREDVIKIQKDLESIDKSIGRIEVTVNKTDERLDVILDQSNARMDEIIRIRNADHLEKPLNKYQKIGWSIALGVITFLLGVLIAALFPGL